MLVLSQTPRLTCADRLWQRPSERRNRLTLASIRAKVEHAFRVIKRQFGRVKVRYRSLGQKTAQLKALFALSDLWMASKTLQVLDGQIRPATAHRAWSDGNQSLRQ